MNDLRQGQIPLLLLLTALGAGLLGILSGYTLLLGGFMAGMVTSMFMWFRPRRVGWTYSLLYFAVVTVCAAGAALVAMAGCALLRAVGLPTGACARTTGWQYLGLFLSLYLIAALLILVMTRVLVLLYGRSQR